MTTAEFPGTREKADTPVGRARLIHEDGRTIVRLSGEHDLTTKDLLGAALAKVTAVCDDSEVVIDLTEAQFIDATTISAIVRFHGRLGGGNRTLTLRNPSSLSLRVIEVCGLASLVEKCTNGSPGPS